MLEIRADKAVTEFISTVPAKHAEQLVRKMEMLQVRPYPPNSKLLKGIRMYRVRSGVYRIIYRVEEEVVHIYLIGKRNDDEVYRLLNRFDR